MWEAIIGAVAGVVKGVFGFATEGGQQRTERIVQTSKNRSDLLMSSSTAEGVAAVVVLLVVMVVLVKA